MVGGRGPSIANTGAWQLNKGAHRLEQFPASHLHFNPCLVKTILMIYMRINLPYFVQFKL